MKKLLILILIILFTSSAALALECQPLQTYVDTNGEKYGFRFSCTLDDESVREYVVVDTSSFSKYQLVEALAEWKCIPFQGLNICYGGN